MVAQPRQLHKDILGILAVNICAIGVVLDGDKVISIARVVVFIRNATRIIPNGKHTGYTLPEVRIIYGDPIHAQMLGRLYLDRSDYRKLRKNDFVSLNFTSFTESATINDIMQWQGELWPCECKFVNKYWENLI